MITIKCSLCPNTIELPEVESCNLPIITGDETTANWHINFHPSNDGPDIDRCPSCQYKFVTSVREAQEKILEEMQTSEPPEQPATIFTLIQGDDDDKVH
jgi:hypothetical protein